MFSKSAYLGSQVHNLTHMNSSAEQHELIKMRLRVAGSSFAKISRELDCALTTVSMVSKGKRRSKRIEQAIADKLGVSHQELWQDRQHTPTDLPSLTAKETPACK